ncbi:hypothetical protein GobsT_51190 [Gemmata obscuriglobus]|uniref:Uncharacterized protein n=1 Tax=Gemmata obscuriglobus TaxID=114 RepID=A0A2Z3GY83_9BACT|nr:hypothetical protein [Gemmata obscuriglobus]AWM36992.1 hypothetical protein C1280_08140 [Gemmata obscuriglobus]QEG30314.1 hypothetical protein GobsT_51190 [Gemmata obscuriglobus]VTS09638.1 unnamed protein product [Gemmata obscuriglobus UQM 2246]
MIECVLQWLVVLSPFVLVPIGLGYVRDEKEEIKMMEDEILGAHEEMECAMRDLEAIKEVAND